MHTLVRMSRIELPTYDVLPENPSPWFAKRLGAHPFPYRLQNRLSGERTVRSHDAVVLENEFLVLTFLPDLGCRLFSVYDKILGREVFYRNDCIKPALIAIRGAWTSGGVEFNFPVSHSVYTHSRIPHTTRTNDDGSASMIFGLTEQMTGLRFTVEVTLVPGEYRFSERIRLYNGTPLPRQHYWWTNAAVALTPDTEMVYPMHTGISGRFGDRTRWPVHEGIDLSWARNHPSAGDIFARETYDEFFGVYHHDLGGGIAHWAKQDELPARKMFFWGADAMGGLWQRNLTEEAGDYLEIQAGRYATQSDFDFLQPHELVELTEYWIPVANTGGFVKADPEGVINVVPEGDGSRVAVQLTTAQPHAHVLFSVGPDAVQDLHYAFEPGRVYWFDVPAQADDLAVRVFDAAGSPLLNFDPGIKERRIDLIPRPGELTGAADVPTSPTAKLHGSAGVPTGIADEHPHDDPACNDSVPPHNDGNSPHNQGNSPQIHGSISRIPGNSPRIPWNSPQIPVNSPQLPVNLPRNPLNSPQSPRNAERIPADEKPICALGEAIVNERKDSPATATAKYESLLGTALDAEARKGLARLALQAGRLDDAAEHARAVLAVGPDADAAYYLALALGDTDESADLLVDLRTNVDYRTRAFTILIARALARGDGHRAEMLSHMTQWAPMTGLLHAVARRRLGDESKARAVLDWLLAQDPLWRHARWEALFHGVGEPVALDPESFQEDMDAAAWYWELNLREEARAILTAWAEAGAPEDARYDILAGALGVEPPAERAKHFGIASCFAHGDALLPILSARTDPESRTHLGNILYARGRTEEAVAAWRAAADAGSTDHIPWRNLALAHWQRKEDVATAYTFMRRAHDACPTDPDTLRDLDVLAELSEHYADRPAIADEMLRHAPDDSLCLVRAIKVLLETERLDEAVDLLLGKRFFVAELEFGTRILYVRALLMRGSREFAAGNYDGAARDFRRATEYPANLGASRFHDSSDAQAHYLLGLALDRLGRTEESRAAWEVAAHDTPVRGTEQAYYIALSRQHLGMDNAQDAFALILPDASEEPSTDQETARRHYLTALAASDESTAQEHFRTAMSIERADPVKMHNHLEHLAFTRVEGRRHPIAVWWTDGGMVDG